MVRFGPHSPPWMYPRSQAGERRMNACREKGRIGGEGTCGRRRRHAEAAQRCERVHQHLVVRRLLRDAHRLLQCLRDAAAFKPPGSHSATRASLGCDTGGLCSPTNMPPSPLPPLTAA